MFLKLTGGHVYAPEDMGIQDVLMSEGKIIQIADHIDFSFPQDYEEIDCTGKTIVPGFFDQHVHILGGGGENGFASLIRELQMTDCIRYGVTSVVGLLGTDAHAKSVPALIAKTKGLREQGISAWCLTGSYAYPSTTLTGSLGTDVAFIDEVIGVKIAISDHRSSQVDRHELTRVASEVRTAALLAKKPGVVHMHTGTGKIGYKDVMKIVEESDIPVTQFRPTHVANQYEDAIAFAKMGGYIDFTSGLDTAETAKILAETLKEIPLRQITLSSDSNGSFPKWSADKKIIGMGIGKMETLYQTIKDLIQIEHVDISTAISIITKNVADALEMPQKGRLQTHADADCVILDENLNIDGVVALGKVMMKDKTITAKNYYDYE